MCGLILRKRPKNYRTGGIVIYMDREIIVTSEGAILDDSGNLISTMYVDAREEAERTAIPALVKGCKREHALEDGETLLISNPARFREYGENLIKDIQEGSAQKESVTETELTPAQARKQRTLEDLNEARELLSSRVRWTEKVAFRKSQKRGLSYGKDWWIYSTSIEPNAEEWEPWRATLPDDYDHVSKIGQPAKFAQALARMVTEKIGPQDKGGWINHTVNNKEVGKTKHPTQLVMHGPVIYTNEVYDFLANASDDLSKMVAFIFTKSMEYATQREYRFAVFNGGLEEETILLPISGMMRDSLKRIEKGLIRKEPTWTAPDGADDQELPSKTNGTPKLVNKQTTITDRLTTREANHLETRTPDGQVLSSEGEQRERISERTVTQKHDAVDEDPPTAEQTERVDDATALDQAGELQEQQRGDHDRGHSEEKTVQEIALEESESNGGSPRDNDRAFSVHSGAGRVFKPLLDALHEPASPVSPAAKTWQEAASSPEEIATTYGVMEILALKMADISEEFRQDVASAGWHATYCIRNIFARFGNIVDSVWIERERFVVLRLKDSRELNVTGRIVISPSGAYAYCIQSPNSEISGWGEEWGTKFFPMGTQIEDLETYGWPAKEDGKVPSHTRG